MAERNDRHHTYNKRKRIPDNREISRRTSNNITPPKNRQERIPDNRRYEQKPLQRKKVAASNAKHKRIDKKRNRDIMRKNQFIGVDDSYLKENPDAIYNDGFDGFKSEFKPVKRRRALTPAQVKAKKITLLTFFVLVAGAIGIILSLTVFFETEKINVVFEDKTGIRYTSQEIIKEAKLSIGENLFLSDKKSASNRILSAFPYIEKADISIKIPDTLEISVKQAKPIYYAESGKKYIVLGSNNKILETSDKTTYKIPLLKGVTLKNTKVGDKFLFEEKSVKKILDSLISTVEKNKLTNINEIDLSTLSNIKLRYDNRINIILGTNSAIDYKIRTALAIMNEKLSKTDKGTLDVSLCNEGKRQSSFLPDDMANPENDIVIPSDTDVKSDSDTENTDETDTEVSDNNTQNPIEDYPGYNDDYYNGGD